LFISQISLGTHQLDIDYAGHPITDSPYEVKIYDSSKIIVSDILKAEVNKICEFTIDASSAGEGQLEIAINDGTIKNNVKQIRPGMYLVSFVPPKADNSYTIDVKFNNELVPSCPKKFTIKNAQLPKLSSKIHESVLINEETSFNLINVLNLSELNVKIKSPSGHENFAKYQVQKLSQITKHDTDYSIKWVPKELGTYTIDLMYSNHTLKDTPLKIRVFDPKKVKVTNLSETGLVHKPNTFCVDASEAGEGSLEIGITCGGHFIPNHVKPIGLSKFEVQFLPDKPGIHLANISFNGHPINDSPYQIRIIDSQSVKANTKGLGAIPINVATSFQVFTSAFNTSNTSSLVKSTVTGPKGESLPVKILLQPNGDCVGEFVPTQIGQHRIDILYAGQPVSGSPFYANAYDPNACEIRGKQLILCLSFFQTN
jgi:filamin